MRNGVLGVIGEVVCQVLSSPEIDEQARSTRDQLLDKLEVSECMWREGERECQVCCFCKVV